MTQIMISVLVTDQDTEDSECVLITSSVAVPRVGEGFLLPECACLGVFTVSEVVWCFDSPNGELSAEVTLAESMAHDMIINLKNITGVR